MISEYVQTIIDKNTAAVDGALRPENGIDRETAELTLRNAAVLADRLRPVLIAQLGPESQAALAEAARAAEQVAPLTEEDKQYVGSENDIIHEYRVGTTGPLFSLHQMVQRQGLNPANPSEVHAVREAVWLANAAFTTILSDPATERFEAVNETLRYFDGNATAAIASADAKLSEQQ